LRLGRPPEFTAHGGGGNQGRNTRYAGGAASGGLAIEIVEHAQVSFVLPQHQHAQVFIELALSVYKRRHRIEQHSGGKP
jgi:hypothetical protein